MIEGTRRAIDGRAAPALGRDDGCGRVLGVAAAVALSSGPGVIDGAELPVGVGVGDADRSGCEGATTGAAETTGSGVVRVTAPATVGFGRAVTLGVLGRIALGDPDGLTEGEGEAVGSALPAR